MATSSPMLFPKLLAQNLLRLGRPGPARTQVKKVLEAGSDSGGVVALELSRSPGRGDRRRDRGPGAGGSRIPLSIRSNLNQAHFWAADPLRPCDQISTRLCCPAGMPSRSIAAASSRPLPLPDRPLPDPGDPRVTHTFSRNWALLGSRLTLLPLIASISA